MTVTPLLVFAVFAAYVVKGLCGFANTLVLSTILGFRESNASISPFDLVLSYPANLLMAWRERRAIQLRICIPLSVMVLLGAIPGAIFLKNADAALVKAIFGVVVVVLGVDMLLRERRGKKKQSRLLLLAIGVLSGLLGGLFGITAPLAAYVGRTTEDSAAFRGNLCLIFAVENTFRLVLYTAGGLLTGEILRSALMCYPVMILGIFCGVKLAGVIREQTAKRVITITLILLGLSLLGAALPRIWA